MSLLVKVLKKSLSLLVKVLKKSLSLLVKVPKKSLPLFPKGVVKNENDNDKIITVPLRGAVTFA